MDYSPAEYTNTAYSAQGKGLIVPPTPIEVTIETDELAVTVRGCDGEQVHQTLFTTLTKLKKRKAATSDDALLVGVAIATVVGILIIVGSAFYSLGQRNILPTPISKSS